MVVNPMQPRFHAWRSTVCYCHQTEHGEPMDKKTECKVVLYGISPKNCDTIKKARKWLEQAGIDYRFHDHRADGLNPADLDRWLSQLGWEALLNSRGTTFRALPDEAKQGLDTAKARALLLEHPAMIKRPLLDRDGELTLGFKADHYQSSSLVKLFC